MINSRLSPTVKQPIVHIETVVDRDLNNPAEKASEWRLTQRSKIRKCSRNKISDYVSESFWSANKSFNPGYGQVLLGSLQEDQFAAKIRLLLSGPYFLTFSFTLRGCLTRDCLVLSALMVSITDNAALSQPKFRVRLWKGDIELHFLKAQLW